MSHKVRKHPGENKIVPRPDENEVFNDNDGYQMKIKAPGFAYYTEDAFSNPSLRRRPFSSSEFIDEEEQDVAKRFLQNQLDPPLCELEEYDSESQELQADDQFNLIDRAFALQIVLPNEYDSDDDEPQAPSKVPVSKLAKNSDGFVQQPVVVGGSQAPFKRRGSPTTKHISPRRPRLASPAAEFLVDNASSSQTTVRRGRPKGSGKRGRPKAVPQTNSSRSRQVSPGDDSTKDEAGPSRSGAQTSGDSVRRMPRRPIRHSKEDTELLAHTVLLDQFSKMSDEAHLQVCETDSDAGIRRWVKTLVPLAKGDFVVEYQGSMLTHKEALEQEKMLDEKQDKKCHLFFFNDTKRGCIRVVDTSKSHGKARFTGHSKNKANLQAKVVDIYGETKVVFVAVKDIAANSELLFNYGSRFPKDYTEIAESPVAADNLPAEGQVEPRNSPQPSPTVKPANDNAQLTEPRTVVANLNGVGRVDSSSSHSAADRLASDDAEFTEPPVDVSSSQAVRQIEQRNSLRFSPADEPAIDNAEPTLPPFVVADSEPTVQSGRSTAGRPGREEQAEGAVRWNPSRHRKEETERLARTVLLDQFKAKSDEKHLKVFEDKSNPGKGRCLQTLVPLAPGDFVAEYQGPIISHSEAVKQEKILEEKQDMRCYFLFFYDPKLQRKRVVDSTKSRGKARFVNHSKSGANVQAKVIEVEGATKVIFVATTKIEAGAELLLDYGDNRPSAVKANPFLKS